MTPWIIQDQLDHPEVPYSTNQYFDMDFFATSYIKAPLGCGSEFLNPDIFVKPWCLGIPKFRIFGISKKILNNPNILLYNTKNQALWVAAYFKIDYQTWSKQTLLNCMKPWTYSPPPCCCPNWVLVLVLRVSQVVKFIFVFLDIRVFFQGLPIVKIPRIYWNLHNWVFLLTNILFSQGKKEQHIWNSTQWMQHFINIKKVLPKK